MSQQTSADGLSVVRVREEADTMLSHTFRALADADYRIVLETIARESGPVTAHGVARRLAKRQINVANVLRQLRRNQAVVMSGSRHQAHYRMVAANLLAAAGWLERFRNLLEDPAHNPLPARDGGALREAAFETLLDGIEDAVAIIRENGTFEYANDAFARFIGVTVGELYFAELGEFFLPDERAAMASFGPRLAEDLPLSVVRRDGSVVHVRHWLRTIESPAHEILGWTLVVRPAIGARLSLR